MASTPPETPSSLQEQCLQYLIDHLEDIPVEFLAILPTAIRRTLAVHLPVADILQLEQTRFASGLDMPGVWKEVCEIRHLFSQYPKLVEMFENEIEDKEFVMMVVAYEALHHREEKPHNFQAKRVNCRLVRKPHNFKPHIPGPPVFVSRINIETPLKVQNCAVPSRFLNMHLDGSILKLLSTRYDICLERLYIDYNSCVGGSNLVKVLPRLKQLSISCMNFGNSQSSYFKLVHSLLSGCSHCLHTLTLDDCPDETIEKIVSTVVSVFTDKPVNIQSLRHFCVTVYRASEERNDRWCVSEWLESMIEIEDSFKKALPTLCKAIQTHTSLQTCSLRRWQEISDQNMYSSILSFFEQPQFQCLTLTETSLSLEGTQHLIHTFLSIPCSGPQMLKLERIQLLVNVRDHIFTPPSIRDNTFLLYKSLVLDCRVVFHSFTYINGVDSSVKKWLDTICTLQLHSVTVTSEIKL